MKILKIEYIPRQYHRRGLSFGEANTLAKVLVHRCDAVSEGVERFRRKAMSPHKDGSPEKYVLGRMATGTTMKLSGRLDGPIDSFVVKFGSRANMEESLRVIDGMLRANLVSAEMEFEFGALLCSSFRWKEIEGEWDLEKIHDSLEKAITLEKEIYEQLPPEIRELERVYEGVNSEFRFQEG